MRTTLGLFLPLAPLFAPLLQIVFNDTQHRVATVDRLRTPHMRLLSFNKFPAGFASHRISGRTVPEVGRRHVLQQVPVHDDDGMVPVPPVLRIRKWLAESAEVKKHSYSTKVKCSYKQASRQV